MNQRGKLFSMTFFSVTLTVRYTVTQSDFLQPVNILNSAQYKYAGKGYLIQEQSRAHIIRTSN